MLLSVNSLSFGNSVLRERKVKVHILGLEVEHLGVDASVLGCSTLTAIQGNPYARKMHPLKCTANHYLSLPLFQWHFCLCSYECTGLFPAEQFPVFLRNLCPAPF